MALEFIIAFSIAVLAILGVEKIMRIITSDGQDESGFMKRQMRKAQLIIFGAFFIGIALRFVEKTVF
ncbi:MAG: hypothetical protein Q8N88_05690 [Nanoarchaeota archaeon]|nr:hypothetical protein [Nanoarchaeota archaeon]